MPGSSPGARGLDQALAAIGDLGGDTDVLVTSSVLLAGGTGALQPVLRCPGAPLGLTTTNALVGTFVGQQSARRSPRAAAVRAGASSTAGRPAGAAPP